MKYTELPSNSLPAGIPIITQHVNLTTFKLQFTQVHNYSDRQPEYILFKYFYLIMLQLCHNYVVIVFFICASFH